MNRRGFKGSLWPWTNEALERTDVIEEILPEEVREEEHAAAGELMTCLARAGDWPESDADDPWTGCYR